METNLKKSAIENCKHKQSCIDNRFDYPEYCHVFADHYHDENGNRVEATDFCPDDKHGFFRGN